jgi:predicted O-methyltransferase YrrM
MNFQEIIRQELAALDDRTGHAALDIVETGTIRGGGDTYRTGDGWSTVAFAEHVRDNGGSVTSIDLDVAIARAVLAGHADRLDRHVELVQGYSVQVLTRLAIEGRRFDVVLLDSDNDAQLIIDEWLVASTMLERPGLLIVDDVDLKSALVVKGHKLVPWLDREGVSYEITQRDAGGYTTGVLVARLD